MILTTKSLRLRPLRMADTPTIARLIFSDPDVVAMLAHDTRRAEDAYAQAERWTSLMAEDGTRDVWQKGGLGLFAITPRDDPALFMGTAGFYLERGEHNLWVGEYFYALGTQFHGRGVMSQAGDALTTALTELADFGAIYATYWDYINEASGRILRRGGLLETGRKLVAEEYGTDRCRAIFEYDLWRLSSAKTERADEVAVQACRRAGAFVGEGILSRARAVKALTDAFGAPLPEGAIALMDMAISEPGMAYLERRHPDHPDVSLAGF